MSFLILLENPEMNRHCSSRESPKHPLFHASLFSHDARNKNAMRCSIIYPSEVNKRPDPLPMKSEPHCGMT